MRLQIVSLLVFALCLACVPALADTTFDSGPINGTTDAWSVNFGFVVSNSFTVQQYGAIVTGLSFGAWLFPGDVLTNAEVSITDAEFGGNTFFDGFVNFTQSDCSANQYGFNVCTETSDSFGPVNLASGTYWVNLENALAGDDPVYWDENSSPYSQASENSVGTIPSEAFSILGTVTSATTSTSTAPEPTTVMLFGSGVLGLTGLLRRKLF